MEIETGKNCLILFDHFVGLTLRRLSYNQLKCNYHISSNARPGAYLILKLESVAFKKAKQLFQMKMSNFHFVTLSYQITISNYQCNI